MLWKLKHTKLSIWSCIQRIQSVSAANLRPSLSHESLTHESLWACLGLIFMCYVSQLLSFQGQCFDYWETRALWFKLQQCSNASTRFLCSLSSQKTSSIYSVFTLPGTGMGQSCVLLFSACSCWGCVSCWRFFFVTWIHWKCSRKVSSKLCLFNISLAADVERSVNSTASKAPFVVYISSYKHVI